ncbi:hypothetical protein HUJ05_002679 [Dendroctonus ponderosae]|nr:hypothetical protein HUJ05_002679 [Dendroctonus ponderosae]
MKESANIGDTPSKVNSSNEMGCGDIVNSTLKLMQFFSRSKVLPLANPMTSCIKHNKTFQSKRGSIRSFSTEFSCRDSKVKFNFEIVQNNITYSKVKTLSQNIPMARCSVVFIKYMMKTELEELLKNCILGIMLRDEQFLGFERSRDQYLLISHYLLIFEFGIKLNAGGSGHSLEVSTRDAIRGSLLQLPELQAESLHTRQKKCQTNKTPVRFLRDCLRSASLLDRTIVPLFIRSGCLFYPSKKDVEGTQNKI